MLMSIALYTLASSLLTVIPGPDNAVLLRNALRGSRRYALLTVLGTAVGVLCWGGFAALGLTAMLAASRVGYDVVRVLGAVYLVMLAIRMWRHAGRGLGLDDGGTPARASAYAAFRLGLATDLLNPKAGVFFVSFLPQFIPAGSNVPAMTMLFALIQALLNVLWALVIVVAVAQVRSLLASSRIRRRLERATALLMVSFGVRLVLERA
jgi:threonine/homoserine/homoserine lactone efflux protein